MKEDFLHVIWQNQYVDRTQDWSTESGKLTVIKPGFRNRMAGPDFHQATLIMGDLEWVGSVEIHVKASEWNQHGHQSDANYQSVILHVVWEKDTDVFRSDGTIVPTFELKNLIPLEVLLKYRSLMDSQKTVKPCAPFLPSIEPLVLISMQERVLIERMERKSELILERLNSNQKNWLETFYQTIAWNLGLKSNSEAMLSLAQQIPIKQLGTLGWKLESILPIFLGMAGFLDSGLESETEKQQANHYQFYAKKFELQPPVLQWNTFRIRGSAAPMVRVVLLARIVSQLPDWFQQLTENEEPNHFFEHLELEPLPDWVEEFLKEHKLSLSGTELSEFVRNSLVVNSFSPMLTAMSLHTGEREWIEKALDWLSALKPEKNVILDLWHDLSIKAENAAQSQGLIELQNEYCLRKRCMECAIGQEILRK